VLLFSCLFFYLHLTICLSNVGYLNIKIHTSTMSVLPKYCQPFHPTVFMLSHFYTRPSRRSETGKYNIKFVLDFLPLFWMLWRKLQYQQITEKLYCKETDFKTAAAKILRLVTKVKFHSIPFASVKRNFILYLHYLFSSLLNGSKVSFCCCLEKWVSWRESAKNLALEAGKSCPKKVKYMKK
jgi:hypothetical protein